jgi:hypothetical protein
LSLSDAVREAKWRCHFETGPLSVARVGNGIGQAPQQILDSRNQALDRFIEFPAYHREAAVHAPGHVVLQLGVELRAHFEPATYKNSQIRANVPAPAGHFHN